MNKQILKIPYIITLLVGIQSCYIDLDDGDFHCDTGSGPLVTETRAISSFHSITNAISANVVIRQDVDRTFRITARENILNNISTRVIDGELVIDQRGCFRNPDIDIFISTPEIAGVHNAGSGTIIGDNVWHSDQLHLTLNGSGRMDTEFFANSVDAEIAGSGTIDLYGEVNSSFMRVSGSGNIFAFNLESNHQEVQISGSGNCEVYARDRLDVRINGSGNVFYKGNPSVTTNISGSGNVVEAN